jgi:hypothetical protein
MEPLDMLAAATGTTGPAFAAFGRRAVDMRYMTQEELDQVAFRLALDTADEDREAKVIEAMRRFIALDQPLADNVRLKGFPVNSLNGLRARCDPTQTPEQNRTAATRYRFNSGMPKHIANRQQETEVYNVYIQTPGAGDGWYDDSWYHIRVTPQYLRPGKVMEASDPYAKPIPSDGEEANSWFKQAADIQSAKTRLINELFTDQSSGWHPERPERIVKRKRQKERKKMQQALENEPLPASVRCLIDANPKKRERKAKKEKDEEPEWVTDVEDGDEDGEDEDEDEGGEDADNECSADDADDEGGHCVELDSTDTIMAKTKVSAMISKANWSELLEKTVQVSQIAIHFGAWGWAASDVGGISADDDGGIVVSFNDGEEKWPFKKLEMATYAEDGEHGGWFVIASSA